MIQFDLSGRTAVVTGGAKGIGEAIVRTLAMWRIRRGHTEADPLLLRARGPGNGCALPFQSDEMDLPQIISTEKRFLRDPVQSRLRSHSLR